VNPSFGYVQVAGGLPLTSLKVHAVLLTRWFVRWYCINAPPVPAGSEVKKRERKKTPFGKLEAESFFERAVQSTCSL
jgi:hypothetical protein